MRRLYTHSDGGCFLFGNETFSFSLPNNYGDCRNAVLIFEDEQEYIAYMKNKYGESKWYRASDWQTTLRGRFNLYRCDSSNMNPKDIAAKFNGRYEIYLRTDLFELPVLFVVKR